VDMICAGHTHQAIAQDINGIAVVQAYSSGRSFSRVDLTVDATSGKVAAKHIFPPRDVVAGQYEHRTVRPDPIARAALAPAVRQALTMKNRPLGLVLDTPFARGTQQDETALADLITDGMPASIPGADAAFGNGGSLRTDLAAGPLTYGEVYEVYPFDNRLVILSLTGDQLTRIISYSLTRRALPTELLPIAGFTVDATCDGGMLRVVLERPSGMPIRPDERLNVVTSDFVAGGGDGIVAPAGPLGDIKSPDGAPILRESVVAWLRGHGGHFDEHHFVAPDKRRWHFPAPRPMMCQ